MSLPSSIYPIAIASTENFDLPDAGHKVVAGLLIALTASLFISTALMNLLALLISVVALGAWYRYRPWALLRAPLALLCILFLSWTLLRDGAAGSGWAAWRSVDDFRPLIYVVLWAPLFAPLMHRKAVAVSFGVCMAIFCMVVLAVTLWTGAPANQAFYHRAPDLSGPLLVVAIIAAMQLAWQPNAQPQNLRWLWTLAALLGTVALFFATTRRTGYVAFAACLVLLSWLNLPKLNARTMGLGLLVCLLPIALLMTSATARLRMVQVAHEMTQFSATAPMQQGQINTSSGLRLRFWTITSELIKEAPLVGVGIAQFPERYRVYDTQLGGSIQAVKNPHNEYLYVLAGLGVVGLGLYLGIQWSVVRRARQWAHPAQRHIVWLAMLAFMVSILFNSMLIDTVPGHFYALTLLCLSWFSWNQKGASQP